MITRSPVSFLAAMAAIGLTHLVEEARTRLPAEPPEPPAVPARSPLPAPVKREHLDAVAALQRRINVRAGLSSVGIVSVVALTMPVLWESDQLFAAALLIGGLLLVGLTVPGMVAPLRAKNRHVALLREHGVRLDALGNEKRFVRSRTERATRHFT
jgi:hypothetical protein